MDSQELIKCLKVRSGKSLKAVYIRTLEKVEDLSNYHLCIFASSQKKFCVMLFQSKSAELDFGPEKCYLIKNLEYCTEIEELPIFKLTETSSIKESKTRYSGGDVKPLTDQICAKLMDLNIDDYLGSNVIADPVQKIEKKLVPILNNSLSLAEYFQARSSQFGEQNFVEVLFF